MDKFKKLVGASDEWIQCDVASVAQSVQADFSGLVAIFDRQLESPIEIDGEARTAIAQAKSAAQRGLELSARLISMLQASRSSA